MKANINGKTETISDNITICADDGTALFTVELKNDGSLEIQSGFICIHNKTILDPSLLIQPKSLTKVVVSRPIFKSN